jgi:ELWxxDGT repeat protein
MLRQAVLFEGDDASGHFGLWESNGTAAGTYELTGISGAFSAGIFGTVDIPLFATFNGEVLFDGSDTSGNIGLWVTNGMAAGTTEVGGLGDSGVSGASSGGLNPFNFAVFNGEVLFWGARYEQQRWLVDD